MKLSRKEKFMKFACGCVMGVIGLLAVLIVCAAISKRNKDSVLSPSQTVEQATPVDIHTALKNGQELISWLGKRNSLNSLQNDEALSRMKGKTIVVKGKVRDVGRTTFGEHVYVSLTVGQIDKFERMNIQFNVSDMVAETVKSWMKGEERIMRGWIKEEGDLIEVSSDTKQLIEYWGGLSPEQKKSILDLMKNMNQK